MVTTYTSLNLHYRTTLTPAIQVAVIVINSGINSGEALVSIALYLIISDGVLFETSNPDGSKRSEESPRSRPCLPVSKAGEKDAELDGFIRL